MKTKVWVNGLLNGKLCPNDPGITRGLTVFETMRTYDSKVFKMDEHLNRLELSARFMEIPYPNIELIRAEIKQARQQNVWIRISLTKGGQRIIQTGDIDYTRVGKSVEVATIPMTTKPWLPGSIKHSSRAAWNMASKTLGVEEVIFLDDDGNILEANRSNVFSIVEGILITPPADGRILAGITRETIIKAAKDMGLPVRCEAMNIEMKFDELYLCSTLKEIAPIISINGVKAAGSGEIGRKLQTRFDAITKIN